MLTHFFKIFRFQEVSADDKMSPFLAHAYGADVEKGHFLSTFLTKSLHSNGRRSGNCSLPRPPELDVFAKKDKKNDNLSKVPPNYA
jgi:hypothetical protein